LEADDAGVANLEEKRGMAGFRSGNGCCWCLAEWADFEKKELLDTFLGMVSGRNRTQTSICFDRFDDESSFDAASLLSSPLAAGAAVGMILHVGVDEYIYICMMVLGHDDRSSQFLQPVRRDPDSYPSQLLFFVLDFLLLAEEGPLP
jgi:hypothetical protein